MQHDVAERDAFGERDAGQLQAAPRRRLGARARQRRKLARGDHLGEHHRGGLQRLDLFLRIGAMGAVLHHENAERIAGAQHRHAEERVVDFFARFRPEREGRMLLRLREIDRIGLARDQADEAFVGADDGQVDGGAIEALGGVKLEGAVDAQDINRADLRNHVGGDQHNDLVEAFLRADRLRHHFAKPAQQHARTAERATNHVRSLGRSSAGPDIGNRCRAIRRAPAPTANVRC